MSKVNEKYASEALLSEEARKKLGLVIRNGSVTTDKLKDGAVTPDKLEPGLWENIDSTNRETQEGLNRLQEWMNEFAGGLEITANTDSYEAGKSASVTITAKTKTGKKGDWVIRDSNNVTVYEESDASQITYTNTIDKDTYYSIICKQGDQTATGQWAIIAAFPTWLGAGNNYTDIKTDAYKRVVGKKVEGRYEVAVASGQRIYLLTPKEVIISKVTMGGFEIPMNDVEEVTLAISGYGNKVYKVYESSNTYQEGTYQVSVNVSDSELVEHIEAIDKKIDNYPVADGEDIVAVTKTQPTEQQVLMLADKAYHPASFSGLGRKYLRKNIIPIEHEYRVFGGFVENVEVEIHSAIITSGSPLNVVFDRVNEVFLYGVGLSMTKKYYMSWSSEEVPMSDYALTSEPLDMIFMYGGVPYKWNGENLLVDDEIQEDGLMNQLTQDMINEPNTIYHIQYDYDLNGQTITVPEGCTLEFDGGSLRNSSSDGGLKGTKTVINAGNKQLFYNVSFSGSWVGTLNALWVGAKPASDSFDNSLILQKWVDQYSNFFRVIEFPLDTYYFLTPIVKNDESRYKEIRGNNSNFNVSIPDSEGKGQTFITVRGENFTIKDVTINNVRKSTVGDTSYSLTKTQCIYFKAAQLFGVSGVTIRYFDIGIYIEDVWYGGFSGINVLFNNRIGVFAIGVSSAEVNTIDFRNIRFKGVPVATAQAVWPQEEGESDTAYSMRTASVAFDFHCISNNCKFDSVTMEGFDYGIRFNNVEKASGNGTMRGIANITKCYFEANRVFDIYTGSGWIIREKGYTHTLCCSMSLLIDSCLFHTLKKLSFTDATVIMIGCHEKCEVGLSANFTSVRLIHDGSAQCDSTFATCICPQEGEWGNTGYASISGNFRGQLLRGDKECSILTLYNDAFKLNTAYNSSTKGYDSGSIVRRTFEMWPSIGMQDIIQPLRCYYDAPKNTLFTEVISGGEKRMAIANYKFAMRILGGGLSESIPLSEFFRLWDAKKAFTGKVAHLFPYTIVADPSTGLIKTISGSIVGFGKQALIDNSFNPSGLQVATWIDVDSMCLIYRSHNYTKLSADLIQCGRTYDEILPDSYLRLYRGSDAERKTVAQRINAIYFNLTTSQYEIYNGFNWVPLESRYQRYTYKNHGKSIKERPTMADFPDQLFTDDLTGITYVFKVNDSKTSWSWKSISDRAGATSDRPLLDFEEVGIKFYDTTLRKTIYSEAGLEPVITQEIPGRISASVPSTVTIDNTLSEGTKYWCGYSVKHSWGGFVKLRKIADSSDGEITILSDFNSNNKGVYFTAPSPTEYPFIYMLNSYSTKETVSFNIPATAWVEEDGATAGVKRSGTFAEKPTATDIYVGFKYFCTDKQTTEGATNGIEIIHKGNDVWVDALGRVVS